MDDDFVDVVPSKKRGRRTSAKTKLSLPSEEEDGGDECPSPVKSKRARAAPLKREQQPCNDDYDSLQQKDATQQPKQRLSREEKHYNRALEQAMSESKSSQSRTTSSSDKQEDEEYRNNLDESQDAEFDISSSDQALDSDDDFQPSPKPKKAKKSASKTGKRTSIKTGSTKHKSTTNTTAVCVQLPKAKNQHTALCGTSIDNSVKTSQPGGKKNNLSVCAPPARRSGIRPGVTGGGPVVRIGGAPTIRVGLSRKAPVKQLHKQTVT